MHLRYIILLLWSSALVQKGDEKSVINPERMHKACYGVRKDLWGLGVSMSFDPAPDYPHSEQVAEALEQLLERGGISHDVVEGNRQYVLTLSQAKRHVNHLKVGITSKTSDTLRRMVEPFAREVLAAETTNVR